MDQPHPHSSGSGGRAAPDPWTDVEDDLLEEQPGADDDGILEEVRRPAVARPSLDPASVDGGFGWFPHAVFLAAAACRVAHGLQHQEGPTLTMLGLTSAIWFCFWFAAGELVYRWTDHP